MVDVVAVGVGPLSRADVVAVVRAGARVELTAEAYEAMAVSCAVALRWCGTRGGGRGGPGDGPAAATHDGDWVHRRATGDGGGVGGPAQCQHHAGGARVRLAGLFR